MQLMRIIQSRIIYSIVYGFNSEQVESSWNSTEQHYVSFCEAGTAFWHFEVENSTPRTMFILKLIKGSSRQQYDF